jgi:outer membrane protein assembly factor BamB
MSLTFRLTAVAAAGLAAVAATIATATMAAAGPARAQAGSLATHTARTTAATPAVAEKPDWVTGYDGHAGQGGDARAVAASASTVFVTGSSDLSTAGETSWATEAYQASDGHKVWSAVYSPPGDTAASATCIAVSPAGPAVFAGGDGVIQAYNATTGATLWSDHNAATQGVSALVVSPSGSDLFAIGAAGTSADESYLTSAFNASTGATLWTATYQGPAKLNSTATGLAVNASGSTVYVNGSSQVKAKSSTNVADALVAYDAATGAQQWAARYSTGSDIKAGGVVVSPSGSQVFAGATVLTITSSADDYSGLVLAYDASTGDRQWKIQNTGPVEETTLAGLVDAGGSQVIITEENGFATGRSDFETIAYDPATGAIVWKAAFKGHGTTGGPVGIAATPSGATVFVAGDEHLKSGKSGYQTLAYDPATGGLLWSASYGLSTRGGDVNAIATGGSGSQAFVTGEAIDPKKPTGNPEWETVAYSS